MTIGILLLLALGLRILLSPFGTLNLDHGTFIAWSNMLTQGGLNTFYNSWSDYLPGYLYILAILGNISQILGSSPTPLYKLPAILMDISTGFLIYQIVKEIKNKKWGMIASSLYLFNPAVLSNSTLWGQVDAFTGFFSLLAVYLSRKNIYASAIALALGTMVKPQAALAGIPIVYVFLATKKKLSDYFSYGILGLIVFALGFLPFSNNPSLIAFIVERLGATTSQYPYTSINAFTFWGLWGMWQSDSLFTQTVGYLVPILTGVFLSWKLRKVKHAEYPILTGVMLAGFLFITRLHERHLLPAFAPLAVTTAIFPVMGMSFAILSLTYMANMRYAFVWINENFKEIFSPIAIKGMIISNLASFVLFFASLFRSKQIIESFQTIRGRVPVERQTQFREVVTKKHEKKILISIIAFAFVSRILFLNSPTNEYFDEVYHAFTARVMLHSDPKAWEWWNPHPEGFAYEWTHPPLAKEGMVIGMVFFGEQSIGWRIPGALLGTLSVFVIYLIAKELFKNRDIALLAAAIFSLDGLPLGLSRIGMNDSYILFFMLLSFYLFLREKYGWSSFALGFAFAAKWSTMWFLPILVVSFFALRRKLKPSLVLYAVLPPFVYLMSYIPFFTSGHTVDQFIELQKQMWWYHTGLTATHGYSSPWWSWPFLLRPVWAHVNYVSDTTIANIYLMGNPAVFWFGTASVIMASYEAFVQRNKRLGIVIFAFFGFFASWALSPRIMFMYHFLPSVPFLAIATAYVLKRNPRMIFPFLILATVLFIYFYPHWIGLTVPKWLDSSYYWLPSWR